MALGAPVLKRLAQKIAPKDWLIPNRVKTFNKLKEDARQVHLLLEIRDARIPFTSSNLQFQQFLKWKQHLVVFTKSDLADQEKLREWKEYFRGENYVFVNGYCKRSVGKLMKVMEKRLADVGIGDKTKVVMLVGMPNVGKTALINTMHRMGRRRVEMLEKLTLGKVGLEPYLTKFSFSYKIKYEPPVYAMDTPSVMCPKINDLETGFKLILTGAMRDIIVGKVELARYLLAVINSLRSSVHSKWKADYEARMFLKKPLDRTKKADKKKISLDDHFIEVKGIIATKLLKFEGDLMKEEQMEKLVDAQFKEIIEFYRKTRVGPRQVTSERAAQRLISLYRVGKLGFYTWDTVPVMSTQLLKTT